MNSDVEMADLPPSSSTHQPLASAPSNAASLHDTSQWDVDEPIISAEHEDSVLLLNEVAGDDEADDVPNDEDDIHASGSHDEEEQEADVADGGIEEPEAGDDDEHDEDGTESENSSDDASEDDVDKDLKREEATDEQLLSHGPADAALAVPQSDAGDADSKGPTNVAAVPPTSPLSAPPTSPTKAKKPKPQAVPRVPPPPPPPMQTIRLNITLGGPDNYEISLKDKAREDGVLWGDLGPKRYADEDTSDEDGSDGEDAKKDADGDVKMDAEPAKKKPRKKGKAATEYYDVNDPFIDDSELAIDERTYFAQTKQKGFYVSSGQVALVRDKPSPKKKTKKKLGPALSLNVPTSTASTSTLKPSSSMPAKKPMSKAAVAVANKAKSAIAAALGTKDSPIALDEEDEVDGANGSRIDAEAESGDEAGKKRKRSSTAAGSIADSDGGPVKKRKPVDISSFSAELQTSIEKLKIAIAQESWETKSKFPPNLKPLLAAVALQAVALDEYDDTFFSLMPHIFPYNKFTMSKLIKRTIFADHTKLLASRQDEILEQLRGMAAEGFPRAQEEWERSMSNYEEKQKEKAAALVNGSPEGDGSGLSRQATEDPDPEKEKPEREPGTGPGKGGAHHGPPLKKYRMTEAMKSQVWQLVLLSNETCRLENEKNQLEGSVLQVSEQGLRKTLYQRIVNAFPEGWMSSGQISRDVSAMKKKLEKEAAEEQ
ncbi:unnamed protein product [Mycena citricolor]|uniref:Ubinuclein middle domain-containing protein n=1 Tax=Mycena citricolor TaxID=2018698 RepID=A0AAD2H9L1_9AGAR|nr:unnamed protein product [Mycena citricolor]